MTTPLYISASEETICAIATPGGIGAIAIIRISGSKAFEICNNTIKSKDVSDFAILPAQSIHYGLIYDGDRLLDEVLVSIFKTPNSYTGEDIVEISCHGSIYLQQEILQLLIRSGARMAMPGEFTFRSFINKKRDLSQAEAIADLIVSNSKASHKLAMEQMRGNFSSKIKELRKQFVDFTSLLELELDFSEEDVEFADREKLKQLILDIYNEINTLVHSYELGNVLKNGIPVAIIGKPNVGKSTLLNAVLKEDKAIVSEIPGTTRDAIEDTIVIDGIAFRFIDTAGLRESDETIESMGIERTFEKIKKAAIILYLFDITETEQEEEIMQELEDFRKQYVNENKHFIPVANKIDMLMEVPKDFKKLLELDTIFISAKRNENIHLINEKLLKTVSSNAEEYQNIIVTNTRHYESLIQVKKILEGIMDDMNNEVSSDLLATDIRSALHHLGTITGDITTDEILSNIFKNFCIGK